MYSTESEYTHAERPTRALSAQLGKDKKFRIPAPFKNGDSSVWTLPKVLVRADQGSNINIISPKMSRILGLKLRPLGDIDFAGLSMRSADHREMLLHRWVNVDIGVANFQRSIRCFLLLKSHN